MESHGLDRVCIAMVMERTDTVSILGVVNPGIKLKVSELLKEIAICFSIAIRNKKYLHKTESEALADALTGLYNRMCFDNDILKKQADSENRFTAIYIDVNELHIINHKYGHEAGDEMLKTIAGVFRHLFEGNRMYRIGGDEFFILAENIGMDEIEAKIAAGKERIAENSYHISVGICERSDDVSLEQAVRQAERAMYEDKAEYYREKGDNYRVKPYRVGIERMSTGIEEVDTFLRAMSKRYTGIYYVNTGSDTAEKIIVPEYFNEFADETGMFSKTFYNYIIGMVKGDYHRMLLGFTYYSSWEKVREKGEEISLSYEKIDGSKLTLTIYSVSETETVWTFENAE